MCAPFTNEVVGVATLGDDALSNGGGEPVGTVGTDLTTTGWLGVGVATQAAVSRIRPIDEATERARSSNARTARSTAASYSHRGSSASRRRA
jgi:hypothetical protein